MNISISNKIWIICYDFYNTSKNRWIAIPGDINDNRRFSAETRLALILVLQSLYRESEQT